MKYEQSATTNISDQEKAFRTVISNDPALSYFLETGSIRDSARFAKEAIYKDTGFLTFISPYFQDVYVEAIRSVFVLKDISLMSDVAANPILLDTGYRIQAIDKILVYLEERKAKLASLHYKLQMHEPVDNADLLEYTDRLTICNLNYLPIEFLEFRSTYAGLVMKVINSLVNRDLPTSLMMITNLCELVVDVQTLHDIHALCTLLRNANKEQKSLERGPQEVLDFLSFLSRRRRHGLWTFIGIAIVILH
jgi:hypothetical protein